MKPAVPKLLLATSILFGSVSFFLPITFIVIQPSGYQISTDTVPVYFWRTEISSPLLGSSCSVKIYRDKSPAIEATLNAWQFLGQAAFFTQLTVWAIFLKPHTLAILGALRSLIKGVFDLIVALLLLSCLGILLLALIGPELHTCLFGDKLNILSATPFWPNLLISVASISWGITAILKQKVMRPFA